MNTNMHQGKGLILVMPSGLGNTSVTSSEKGSKQPAPKRYRWTGRELDAAVRITYSRARHYDPSTGSWVSHEPLGYEGADDNFYGFPSSLRKSDRPH